ncbi:MAG: 50S ribosomal protein L9 [Fimbriimonadaceae bacterium]
MRVILKQSVSKVGKEGQVVRVKAGFARNFLFPRGMAVVADKSQVRVLEARNKRLEKVLEATKASAEEIAEKLNGKRIRMEVRSGAGQRLFGAVTSQDIADAIKEQLGVELEKKLVGILQPIKQLGHFGIDIDLHRHVDCRVHLDVVDPVLEEEARKAAEGKGTTVEAKSQKALAEEAIEKIEAEQGDAEEESPEA